MMRYNVGSARSSLARIEIGHTNFFVPTKQINDGHDLSELLVSEAYRDLTTWLLQLNRSMFPLKGADGNVHLAQLEDFAIPSANVREIQQLIEDLSQLMAQAPPDTGPRRFGNIAFRKWFALIESQVDDLLVGHIKAIDPPALLVQELKMYLLDSFGSSQRLDYGTGHELSFLAFLGCLWKVNFFADGEEQVIVLALVQPYLELVRKLILTYTLEPAGSHGVWGLDDHSFLPYIFGSAQLGPAIPYDSKFVAVPTEGSLSEAPSPSSVTDKAIVGRLKNSNFYFAAIQFIYDVKKGPFWEHSPTLYDIGGITDGWAKINKGMLKMYVAEVLGKFPVVQHFKFGSLFRWTRDLHAVPATPSVHEQQHTAVPEATVLPAARNMNAPTTAHWANGSSGTNTKTTTHTGVPSTRAPWASSSQQRLANRDRPGNARP